MAKIKNGNNRAKRHHFDNRSGQIEYWKEPRWIVEMDTLEILFFSSKVDHFIEHWFGREF